MSSIKCVDQELRFEQICGTLKQIQVLYELLEKRQFSISHREMPALKEHHDFVLAHPYISWYLILEGSTYIGDVYIMNNNCVGINLLPSFLDKISAVILFVKARHDPLVEIKSVRPAFFYLNVAPENVRKIKAIQVLGAKAIQITYNLYDV